MSSERERAKTVGELIADLQKLPPDMRVMTRGYEGGYHDCGEPEKENVALNVHSEWWYGPHDVTRDGDNTPTIQVAIL